MPDVGERVMTEDGLGVVEESNILENKIKVRFIPEEKDGEQTGKSCRLISVITQKSRYAV